MSTDLQDFEERQKWSPWAIVAALLLLLIFGVIVFGSIRGCFFVDPIEAARLEAEKKKKEEKKKETDAFVIEAPVVQPSELESPLSFVKPGHWSTASQRMKANARDFIGDSRVEVTNSQNSPFPIAHTPFILRSSRPVLIQKGRSKVTESTFFTPLIDQPMYLYARIEERGLGAGARTYPQVTRMPSYQYFFVVLAKEFSRYGFLKSLDSVRVPYDGESDADETEDPIHYRVVQLDATKPIPLSDNPLTWTSIAYILWDEVDPGDPLTSDQERALVDWLHWGGQLIISGPDSLDLLKGSFLEPYLPATSGGQRKITAEDLASWNVRAEDGGWLVTKPENGGEALKPNVPWSAVKLEKHKDANFLPNTGELFVERQVGRGRIVVSAIQLSERDFINWRSGFQSMFNAILLRRQPRQYFPGYFGDVTLDWADPALKSTRRLDARLNTRVQFVARDLGVDPSYRFEDVPDEFAMQNAPWQNGQRQLVKQYRPSDAVGGLGAWSDFGKTATAARGALRQAAGVEVPGSGFVVLCLAAYLIALVPLNWLIFHTLGRIEWAWIAAPVIAILGTVIIVQRAQLDIGFVRAQTEIAILEQQPGHSRGHLSRYTALYTSLSTTYDLEYANLTTLASPFPTGADYQMLLGQGYQNVDFQRYDNVRLAGVPISSNSTGMVHSEQMTTLDGAVTLGRSTAAKTEQIENRSKMILNSVCVVERPLSAQSDGVRVVQLRGQWIGQLMPGQSIPLTGMNAIGADKPVFVENRRSEAKTAPAERLNLEPMFVLALDPKFMEPGETRLVARVDEVLPGQTITPSASQIRGATLVVAHLKYAPDGPPKADVNTKRDIKKDGKDALEEEFEEEVDLEAGG